MAIIPYIRNGTMQRERAALFSLLTHLGYLIIVPVVCITCTTEDHTRQLAAYLKEERELRRRVSENEGLNDSIAKLQQRYNIDVEKEISKLNDNPEVWLRLLEELNIEK